MKLVNRDGSAHARPPANLSDTDHSWRTAPNLQIPNQKAWERTEHSKDNQPKQNGVIHSRLGEKNDLRG